jgi:predicted secreted protein
MTEAQIGWGAEFWLDNSSGTLTELGEITGIGLPSPETAEVEATHFKSPNRRREYISGLIEDGEATFEMNYVPGSATDVLVREAQTSGTTRDYMIVIPDGAGTWEVTGSCIVRRYERSVPIDDRMTASLTVRFTGAVAEAAGA